MSTFRKRLLWLAIPMVGVCLLVVVLIIQRRQSGFGPEGKGAPRARTRRLDGNHWIVSRLERDSYLIDLTRSTNEITLKPNAGKEPNSVASLSIFKVDEQSPMYAAGFRRDDRILKVNGTAISTMSRAVNLVHEIKACNHLTIQVQRADQIIDYQFDFE